MDTLKRMVVFAHVVESGSFAGAARRLGIARSAVSRHITLLEKNSGVRLLNRTTRRLSLTEAGEIYYQSCTRIIAEAENASQRIRQLQDEPRGSLKIAGPISLGPQLAEAVSEFTQRYSAMNIELRLDDRVVDMVEEGIDISLRIGWLADSGLIARKICESPRLLCASPDYLERHGSPTTPLQLAQHECIIFTLLPTPHQWAFTRGKSRQVVQVSGRIKTNSVIAVRSLLLSGAGIAPLSRFLIEDALKSGQLVPLLPEYDCGSAGVYAVYQDAHYRQAKVRMFIDHVAKRLKHLL